MYDTWLILKKFNNKKKEVKESEICNTRALNFFLIKNIFYKFEEEEYCFKTKLNTCNRIFCILVI